MVDIACGVDDAGMQDKMDWNDRSEQLKSK
jgi:hypothetical protein